MNKIVIGIGVVVAVIVTMYLNQKPVEYKAVPEVQAPQQVIKQEDMLQARIKQAQEAKKGPLSPEAVEKVKQSTADMINDTNVTPSRAWMVAKVTDAVGATQFAPYAAEVARTTMNNMAQGTKDILQGIASKNGALTMHGVKRLAGTATAVGGISKLYGLGASAGMSALGLLASKDGEDPEAKKYVDTVDQFKGGEPLVFKDDHGNEYVLDMAQFNPVDQASRPLQKIMQAVMSGAGGDMDAAKKHLGEMNDIILNTVGKSSVWTYGSKIMEGKKPAWTKDNPEAYDAMLAKFRGTGASDENINRALGVLTFILPKLAVSAVKGLGADTTTGKLVTGLGTGGKELDPMKDIANYAGAIGKAQISESKNKYLNMLRQNVEAKPDQVKPFFDKGLEETAKTVDDMHQAVLAAKEQGKSRSNIVKTMLAANIPNTMIAELLKKEPNPAVLMIGSLEKDLKNDVLTSADGEARKAAAKRYREGMKMMMQFVRTSRYKSAEDIINGK